jgi:hypothetical protein
MEVLMDPRGANQFLLVMTLNHDASGIFLAARFCE